MTFLAICIFSGVFLATYFGVSLFRAWTLKRGLLDHPNERSSHAVPTPRGGGLVIAVVTLAVYLGASYLNGYQVSTGFAVGAVLIVAVSWLDDIYSISFAWRLLVHSIAAVLVLYSCGILTITAPFSDVLPGSLSWLVIPAAFVWIVWMVNAYNFMDGIDGIAGVQAVTAAVGWGIIGLFSGDQGVFVIGGTVLFASLAFLLHNWPPARIFMGDAGSAFLGFIFAAIPFIAVGEKDGPQTDRLLYAAVALLWLFVFDSVFTLLRRAARGERVWQAHREHLYQRLVRSGFTHRTVTLLYFALSALLAAAVIFYVFGGSQLRLVILPLALASSAAAVLAVCWKRQCLFGRPV